MSSSLIMKNRPEGFDSEFMYILWQLTVEMRKPDLTAIIMRFQQWKVEVLTRHAERPVHKFYADHCEICEGKGRANICVNPWCENDCDKEKIFCAHPTPYELQELNEIHSSYLKLLDSVRQEFLAGKRPRSMEVHARKHTHNDVGPN